MQSVERIHTHLPAATDSCKNGRNNCTRADDGGTCSLVNGGPAFKCGCREGWVMTGTTECTRTLTSQWIYLTRHNAYMLYVICYMLYVICYMLYVICYMLYVISYILYLISYILYLISYILYLISYILY